MSSNLANVWQLRTPRVLETKYKRIYTACTSHLNFMCSYCTWPQQATIFAACFTAYCTADTPLYDSQDFIVHWLELFGGHCVSCGPNPLQVLRCCEGGALMRCQAATFTRYSMNTKRGVVGGMFVPNYLWYVSDAIA